MRVIKKTYGSTALFTMTDLVLHCRETSIALFEQRPLRSVVTDTLLPIVPKIVETIMKIVRQVWPRFLKYSHTIGSLEPEQVNLE